MTKRLPFTKPLAHGNMLVAGAFSPDGKLVVTCGGRSGGTALGNNYRVDEEKLATSARRRSKGRGV